MGNVVTDKMEQTESPREVLRRVAAANFSEPTDDLTVPLAIELSEARAEIARLRTELEESQKLGSAGEDLNSDILKIIEGLMATDDAEEAAILESLAIAVEKFEKVAYPIKGGAAEMREEREKLKLTETQMRVLRRMADSLGPWSGVKALKGLCRNGLVRLVDDVHPLGPFYVITAAGKALVCAGRDPVEPQSEPLLHSKVGALQENQGQ